ncbi:PAS domain-containing hybrid sensor histidine kinase/response regulator [Microbulbifer agarilyticus]|uniref:hybrid sensor histidine kinase/response regulator n=1 Tax=Microbulbifer agarilyticus TaxID=260552 RepID=UPI001C968AA5|nr:PAS domain-containing hybrid sensor histidine kinase/response regulator [Microbulbifer agarilyticus]MBY6211753.1 PAS domain-containing hybrid sensor histidine kinase/response regulator [Microbulbifer agarilyticus]
MFSLTLLAVVGLSYLLLLFAIAFWGDRLPIARIRPVKPLLLALAGTYTSAWMFFGVPAQAVTEGWLLPPTFVGACLMLIFGAPLLMRFVRLSKRQGSTSIADFISAQFGGSQWLAAVVALLAVVAIVPYLSLQLRAVADSFLLLADGADQQRGISASVVTAVVGLTLGLFALLFGTRHIDSSVHRNGMLLAVAFEALVKIGALVAVACFVVGGAFDGSADLARAALSSERVAALAESRPADTGFFAVVVLGMAAIFCLPRQFHILMIESDGERDIKTVRRLIPLYLALVSAAVLVVGYGGLLWLPESYTNAERYVLGIPLESSTPWLALLAFIGGLSAGSSMVIIATIALSTMIANTMVVPWWLKRLQQRPAGVALGSDLRRVRRVIIGLLMFAAFGVSELIGSGVSLGTFGLLSLALVAQLAPSMVAAVTWPGHWFQLRAAGVIAGLLVGSAVWAMSALPAALGQADLIAGALGLEWNALTTSCVFGLGLNAIALAAVSLLQERLQPGGGAVQAAPVDKSQLRQLLARFVGEAAAERALAPLAEVAEAESGSKAAREAARNYRETVEKILAGIVGSTSAQRLVRQLSEPDVTAQELQQASEIYQFGRGLLQSSIDNIDQGISVVDANLNLVAWNRRYLALFKYPAEMIYVGRPVAELVRYNASRGECGPGDVEEHVRKRVEHLRNGTAYRVQRNRTDGTVLEIRGNPLPGGGFVTTYTDVSDYQRALGELTEIRNSLEQKVAHRTVELETVNDELQELNRELQAASAGKTRFLAAASHDLVQPLNASRLFIDALAAHSLEDDSRQLLTRADRALASAEQLITDMLQIARMDAGDIRPSFAPVSLDSILDDAVAQARVAAGSRGIRLRYRRSHLWVHSDEKMLRRVVQNLLDNAVKYTARGGVLVAARKRGADISLEVWDTGEGIAPEQQQAIFREFCRLTSQDSDNVARQHGYGLGLATVERLCRLLNSPISLSSVLGRGSVFRVRLPRATARTTSRPAVTPITGRGAKLDLQVLCVDNEPSILEAMAALLSGWGCTVHCARNRAEALAAAEPDLLLMDFHLDDGDNGIDLAGELLSRWGGVDVCKVPCVIISAENTNTVKTRAQNAGWQFLQKPLRPAALRALLQQRQKSRSAESATKVV